MQASCESYEVSDVLYRPLKKATSQEAAFLFFDPPHADQLHLRISAQPAQYPHLECGGHLRFP